MKNIFILNKDSINFCFIFLLFITISCSQNPENKTEINKPIKTDETLALGEKVYKQNCSICHGANGTAGISGSANLQTSSISQTQAIEIISKGKKTMIGFENSLSKAEINAVSTYIQTLIK